SASALFDKVSQFCNIIEPGNGTRRLSVYTPCQCIARTESRTVCSNASSAAHDFHHLLAVIRNAASGIRYKWHNIAVKVGDIRLRTGSIQNTASRNKV